MSTFLYPETKFRLIRIDQSTRRLSLRCTQCNGRMPSFSNLSSLSEVPPAAEHQRANRRCSLSRIAGFSAEQSHAQLWPNNATRLSGRVALRRDESVSVVTVGNGPAQ